MGEGYKEYNLQYFTVYNQVIYGTHLILNNNHICSNIHKTEVAFAWNGQWKGSLEQTFQNKYRSFHFFLKNIWSILDWGSLDHTTKVSLQLPRSPGKIGQGCRDMKRGKFDLAKDLKNWKQTQQCWNWSMLAN